MGLGLMRCSLRAGIAFLLILVAVTVGPRPALRARHLDNEQDLLAHLGREQNVVKKSKYATRLAHLKLQQASDAYAQGDIEKGQKLLGDYLKWVRSSWDFLKGSGRRAERRPQGFKELDITLRQDARQFEDLQHRVPFTDRDPVNKAAEEVEKIRGEVLAALFPGGKPAPPPQPRFRSE